MTTHAGLGLRPPTPVDGITVTGEALRRVAPESAEFLIEITSSAGSAAQALRDNQAKVSNIAQAAGTVGMQAIDVQTISLNLNTMYSPLVPQMQPTLGYGPMPQIGPVGFAPRGPAGPAQGEIAFNPFDVQFGAYHVRNTLRVIVREAARAGEVADAMVKAGAIIVGGFSFRVNDDAGARKAALEAAGRDARAKAEALAIATGKQLGDAIAIAEEVVASNGAYTALRTIMPFAFGAGTPQAAGELEYYARVSARFGLA